MFHDVRYYISWNNGGVSQDGPHTIFVWVRGTRIFAVIMALIVVIAPVSEEVYKIMKEYRKTSDKINGGYGNLETIAMDKVSTNDKTPITNV